MPSRAQHFDVIIVGTGVGGATLGYALSKPGRSILFLEQGRDLSATDVIRGMPPEATREFQRASPKERFSILERAGRSPESVRDGLKGDSYIPYIGYGTGGSSSLYGMALERLFPHDFESWPISYAELSPWYDAAESLFRVSGSPDPLRGDHGKFVQEPPRLTPANQVVFDHLQGLSLHPYRLHLASERIADCRLCQGHLCLSQEQRCKNDARTICLQPALAKGDAQLLTGARVTHLISRGNTITGVNAITNDNCEITFRAKLIVLAGGALSTPRILLQSGNLANRSGLVGRGLMRHAIDLFVLTLAPRFQHQGEAKELALNDFYLYGRERLGIVQSFGIAPPVDYLTRQPGRNMWKLLGPLGVAVSKLFALKPIIAGVLEDNRSLDNFIQLDGRGISVTYRLGGDDLRRRKILRRNILRVFSRFFPVPVFGTSNRGALGHVCGTAMFGSDPSSSVLNALNRAHTIDNLYVMDASFFPTSGGVNPALTIAANALRVAHYIDGEI